MKNKELVKLQLEYGQEIYETARVFYSMMPWSYIETHGKILEYITNKQVKTVFDAECKLKEDEISSYREIGALSQKTKQMLKELTIDEKIKGSTLKRLKSLKTARKKNIMDNLSFYCFLYSPMTETSYENLKNQYRDSASKERLKRNFLRYIQYTQIDKRKQPKRYTVSRDLDKEVFYETEDGRLARIKGYLYKKYMKKGKVDIYMKAYDTLKEGIYAKPMKVINQALPKAREEVKLLLASLFEGIKECEMIIDRDFKKAYRPTYNLHQDTDGDKASNYSCMSGNGEAAENFYGMIPGCYVVRWQTKDGEQVGRCIMYEWEGKRHFIRIYGRYEYHRTMINMLEAQMKEGDLFGRDKKLEGIKLPTNMDEDTEMMYLDGNRYGLKYEEETWYLVADKYDTDCKTTSGDTLETVMYDTSECEKCGRRRSNDDGIWINDCFYCCSDCARDDGYIECERCGRWEHEEDAIYVDNNWYCDSECAERAGYGYDSFNDEWTDDNDLGYTEDKEYYTTREGAANFYDVNESDIEWCCENACWINTCKQEEKDETENEEE